MLLNDYLASLAHIYSIFCSKRWSSREALWRKFEDLSYPETPHLTASSVANFLRPQILKICVSYPTKKHKYSYHNHCKKKEGSGQPSAHTPSPQGGSASFFSFFRLVNFLQAFISLLLKLTNPTMLRFLNNAHLV